MSEELRAKGYLRRGKLCGDPVGEYQGFVIGATTLSQLADAGIIPARSYGSNKNRKPDGLVVDLRERTAPQVRLVIEHKNVGELSTEARREAVFDKAASIYCRALRRLGSHGEVAGVMAASRSQLGCPA